MQRRVEEASRSDPNLVQEAGALRHAEAERQARVEGDRFFKEQQEGKRERRHATVDKNLTAGGSGGEAEDPPRMTRRGGGGVVRPSSGAECNPNSLIHAGPSADDAHTGRRTRSPAAARAGVANPNDTASPHAEHIAPTAAHGGTVPLAASSRRPAAVHPNAEAPCSPRTGGKRRLHSHAAAQDGGVRSVMMQSL